MQETEVYSRWLRPESWRTPGRVTLANVEALDPEEPMQAALVAGGGDLRVAPLREQDGSVNPVVADSDVVVSGGTQLDEGHIRR